MNCGSNMIYGPVTRSRPSPAESWAIVRDMDLTYDLMTINAALT